MGVLSSLPFRSRMSGLYESPVISDHDPPGPTPARGPGPGPTVVLGPGTVLVTGTQGWDTAVDEENLVRTSVKTYGVSGSFQGTF